MTQRWKYRTNLSIFKFLFCLSFLVVITSLLRSVELMFLYGSILLQETGMSNAWYEVLSVLHLMAMLSLSQANLLLLPRTSADGYQPKESEGSFIAKLYAWVIVTSNYCYLFVKFLVAIMYKLIIEKHLVPNL